MVFFLIIIIFLLILGVGQRCCRSGCWQRKIILPSKEARAKSGPEGSLISPFSCPSTVVGLRLKSSCTYTREGYVLCSVVEWMREEAKLFQCMVVI